MIKCKIDNIEFKLKEYQDFSWVNNYGIAFSVIDETGSGCISFGIKKNSKKYFIKIAGAKTISSKISEQESINFLKETDNYSKTYNVLLKATDYDRNNRYKSISEFEAEFKKSLEENY